MANDDLQNLLRTGIQAAQSGNKAIARRILEQVVEQDPTSELGWIWLASVVDSLDERRQYLQRVLDLNPGNERARQALDKLHQIKQPAPPSNLPPRPQSPRPTPHLAEPVSESRPPLRAETDREALLAPSPTGKKRRRSPVLFFTVGLLAVSMIVIGLILFWQELQSGDDESTATVSGVAAFPTGQTRIPDFATNTPIGGTLITLPPRETLPPTWTPTATWTPQPSSTATNTPVPLGDYMLLVSAKRNDAPDWSLYTLLADGSSERPLPIRLGSTDDYTLASTYDAAYSPDGRDIVFTGKIQQERLGTDGATESVEYEELFIVSSRGGVARRLTTLEAAHTGEAEWSPDGTQIIFASDADGDYDLYVMDAEGGTEGLLTRNTAEDRNPTWSPDGTTIAFASDRNGPGSLEIFRMALTGADLKQLTDDVNSSYAPAWSPDGQWIAFLSNRRVNTDLYVMDADGYGEHALIVRDVESEERDPAWSPDSKWIAFSSNRDLAMFELYLIRPDGSDLQRVTREQGDTRYAAWKP